MIETKDIYWLAGLLEGEASFSSGGKSPRIAVAMYDADVIERVSGILRPTQYRINGNTVRLTKHRSDRRARLSVVTIAGGRAAGWMMTLYPLMGKRRRARIRELLENWRSQKGRMYGLKTAD